MATKRKVFTTERLGALTDGVTAIALTLLVLDLKIDDSMGEAFHQVLWTMIPKIDIWIISFFVIGATWILHHNVLSLLKRTTTPFLWLNLLFLMFISFMPWPSWLMGSYPRESAAVALFSGVIGMAGLVMVAQWIYAAGSSRLTAEGVNLQTMMQTTILLLRIPVVAALSIAMAFIHEKFALYIWLLHPLLGTTIRRLVPGREIEVKTVAS